MFTARYDRNLHIICVDLCLYTGRAVTQAVSSVFHCGSFGLIPGHLICKVGQDGTWTSPCPSISLFLFQFYSSATCFNQTERLAAVWEILN